MEHIQITRYPAYRDSGVEWLGTIPSHWGVTSVKHLLSIPITDGPHTTPEFLDEGIPFTVDTDEVYMTTRLQGKNTFFLPFNLGHNHGKGNPPNPFGHKTEYLWKEVFTRQSLANIIQYFVRFDGKDSMPLSKRTLFFPRYHQMDVVRKLLKDAAQHGVGRTYLIQHSAGSGKSNSITWAAYQLIETYPATKPFPAVRGSPIRCSIRSLWSQTDACWTSSCATTSRTFPRSKTSSPRPIPRGS